MTDSRDVETSLRGTSDEFFLVVQALTQLERRKRSALPIDPGFLTLSREVTAAAAEVLRVATEQQRLAEAVQGSPVQASLDAIDEVRPEETLAAILAEWRSVERELVEAPPDSPEAAELTSRFAELRARYASALARVRKGDGLDGR